MVELVDQRIAELHARLRISPPQEAEWRKFAQALKDNARNMDETFQTRVRMMPEMNAMDTMIFQARLSMQLAQDVQNLLPSFRALYGSMSNTQKNTADQIFRDGGLGDARSRSKSGERG